MLGEKRYAKPACNELAIEIEGLDGYRVNKRDCKNVERDMLDIILPELIKNRSLEAAKNWVDAIYCLSGYK